MGVGSTTIVLGARRDDRSRGLIAAALALVAWVVSAALTSSLTDVAGLMTHASLPTAAPATAVEVPLTITESPDGGYVAQGSGPAFRFRDGGVSIGLPDVHGAQLALTFIGGTSARPKPRGILPGTVNRFIGSDPTTWTIGLKTYQEIIYRDVWPGVDIAFRGSRGTLKYDVILEPGASLDDVRFRYEGASGLRIASNGELVAAVPGGHVIDSAPFGIQHVGGSERRLATHFALSPETPNVFGFFVPGGYDPTRTLVIDPGIVYRASLGGGDFDQAAAVAVDTGGNLYVAGQGRAAWGTPTTPGAFDETYNGHSDLFVAKLDATGSLIYSTYIGGADDSEFVSDLALGADGSVYVTGHGHSTGYPTTPGAWNRQYMSWDGYGFLTKLNPSGSSLVYSTRVPGTMRAYSVAVDDQERAFVTGIALEDFPATSGAWDESPSGQGDDGLDDAFVVKMRRDGSGPVYATLVGGSEYDIGKSIAVDGAGNAVVTGYTGSTDFPTTVGSFDETDDVWNDVFVTKLNTSGSDAVYSGLLGGNASDNVWAIEVANDGSAYVAGETDSSTFPTTADAADDTFDGSSDPLTPARDAFLTRISPDGSTIAYSTFLGGATDDYALGMTVEGDDVYVIGETDSDNFPTTDGSEPGTTVDGFLVHYEDGTTPDYSSIVGRFPRAIDVDPAGTIYLAMTTPATELPRRPATIAAASPDGVTSVSRRTRACTIKGTAGADHLVGTSKPDVICAGAGADTVSGGGGSDVIYLDEGNDVVDAGWGVDVVFGGPGSDELRGGGSRDLLIGGAGPDVISGLDGPDSLRGGGHADTLRGGSGKDRLAGGPGPDLLNGGLNRDICSGGPGIDTLRECP